MAIVQDGIPWGEMQRQWGYEVRVNFKNDITSEIYNEVLIFDVKPTKNEIDVAVFERIGKLEGQVLKIEVTNEDGTITQI